MQKIYEDSFTRLEVDADNLYIHHQGKSGNLSFTNIKDVIGRSDAQFGATTPQPIIEVTIDALTRPAAFVLAVPADGDGQRLFELINSLRII